MNKKDELINIATKLFSEKGYSNTPLSKICKKANISKGLIYHHYTSKDDLLREVYKKSINDVTQLIDNKNKNLSVNEEIKEFLEFFFTQLTTKKILFQFDLNVIIQPQTKNVLHDLIKEKSILTLRLVNKVFKKLDSKNSMLLSNVFITELEGVLLGYIISGESYPLSDMKDSLIKKYMSL